MQDMIDYAISSSTVYIIPVIIIGLFILLNFTGGSGRGD